MGGRRPPKHFPGQYVLRCRQVSRWYCTTRHFSWTSLAPVAAGLAQAIGLRPARRRASWSGRLSLSWQFRWASLLILALGLLADHGPDRQQAEADALNRTAALTALYVDSVLADPLAAPAAGPRLDATEIARLDHLRRTTALGERLVDLRVWSPTGEVLYSSTRERIGRHYPLSDKLARALRGWVVADLTRRGDAADASLRTRSDRLLAVYAPVRPQASDGRVLAVIEFHQRPDALLDEIATDRLRAWTLVGAVTLTVYLLLAGIVQRGSAASQGCRLSPSWAGCRWWSGSAASPRAATTTRRASGAASAARRRRASTAR
jgi:hypothetical protein